MRRTITLPSGARQTLKTPGPLAHVAVTGVLPTAASLRRNGDDAMQDEKVLLENIDAFKLAEATVKFVCACTVEPRLTDKFPAPAGFTFFDDLDKHDWDMICEEVGKLREESEEQVRPLSDSTATPS